VISRAIIHIDGPPGAGKTAFVERLVSVLDEWVLAVRCRRDQSLRQARESPSARDPEVRRYRAAGASDAGRFTFPSGRDVADDFFTSRLLTDISDVVVIEGDSPLRDADLQVCSWRRHPRPARPCWSGSVVTALPSSGRRPMPSSGC
jgi:molybdopterin-guanine dinucleotide biosynthesis protein